MLLVEGSKLNFTFLPKHGGKLSLIWLGTHAKWCEIYSEKVQKASCLMRILVLEKIRISQIGQK